MQGLAGRDLDGLRAWRAMTLFHAAKPLSYAQKENTNPDPRYCDLHSGTEQTQTGNKWNGLLTDGWCAAPPQPPRDYIRVRFRRRQNKSGKLGRNPNKKKIEGRQEEVDGMVLVLGGWGLSQNSSPREPQRGVLAWGAVTVPTGRFRARARCFD